MLCQLQGGPPCSSHHPFWPLALGARSGRDAGALRLLLRLAHRLWSLVVWQLRGRCASVALRVSGASDDVLRVAVCGGSACATAVLPLAARGAFCAALRYEADPGAHWPAEAPAGLYRAMLLALDRPCEVALRVLDGAPSAPPPVFSVAGRQLARDGDRLRVGGLVLRRSDALELLRFRAAGAVDARR
jgi:hypothetical protein